MTDKKLPEKIDKTKWAKVQGFNTFMVDCDFQLADKINEIISYLESKEIKEL